MYILFLKVCDTWTVHGSSCYLFDTRSSTWYDAAQLCALYHPKAHLVIIETESENDFVASLVGSSTPWIGLSDEDDQWIWSNQRVSPGTPATFVNWDSDYSNNINRNCAYIRGYNKKWQTYWCNDNEMFVCEVEQ
ncbi:Lectin BRA-3 [Holothuria leucospilota]|uniref:Lectin BRA-3 n=1 Tax=Holothuria leucospilota TaxID=206669 RepID=A0A9Q1BG76_HOLLE|nr:Lectin BRA-3 [Holothuria leucospilota]